MEVANQGGYFALVQMMPDLPFPALPDKGSIMVTTLHVRIQYLP
jgi:hypothetical protein